MLFRLVFFVLIVVSAIPILAQDEQPVENFGRILLSFDLGIDDEDFSSARNVAAPTDLSVYYVSGADGLVYVYDDKGNFEGTLETGEDNIINDLAVDIDKRLIVAQNGALYIFDHEGTFLRKIPGNLITQYYSRVVPLEDGTFYAPQFFGDDRLFHLNMDGSPVEPTREEFFEGISNESVGIFDQFVVGQDGYLYYYNQSEGSFFQFDESDEVLNRYDDLVDVFTLRGGIAVDENGRVLLGGNGGVEVYGAKEALVNTIAGDGTGFANDLQFASDGQLVILQTDAITVVQYGHRDDEDGE